jgi:hypothetical protein
MKSCRSSLEGTGRVRAKFVVPPADWVHGTCAQRIRVNVNKRVSRAHLPFLFPAFSLPRELLANH